MSDVNLCINNYTATLEYSSRSKYFISYSCMFNNKTHTYLWIHVHRLIHKSVVCRMSQYLYYITNSMHNVSSFQFNKVLP